MVRFDEYERLLRVCQRLFIKRVHYLDGFPWAEHFRTEQRALIVANHGPIIGPIVWVSALFPRIAELGFGHFTYSAIAHPIIQNVPIFSRMVGYESQGGGRLRTDDYVELLTSGQLNILSVAPEGEFSLYGNGVDIQPFRSARSLEIALRARCRIVLLIGMGVERWQRNLSIAAPWRKRLVQRLAREIPFLDKLDEQALEQAGQLSVSGMFGRIPDLYVASELYEPEPTLAQLSEDRATRDQQLQGEADRMRGEMVRILHGMRQRAPA